MDASELFKPSTLKQLCATYGLSPSKLYGQHYLISEKPITAILRAADLSPTDTVVEVGPGFGVLTLPLASACGTVVAFEIEQTLKAYWNDVMRVHPNIQVVWGNVLRTIEHLPKGPYKVVANVPYQITSQLFRTFLEAEIQPERIVVMIQKEVAERILAKKGDMNLLALSIQYYGTPHIIMQVPKGAFWPSPKVDSAVIAITHIHRDAGADPFFRIARAGFSSKRKQLWRNVAEGLSLPAHDVKTALDMHAGSATVRPEDLSIDEWKAFAGDLQTRFSSLL